MEPDLPVKHFALPLVQRNTQILLEWTHQGCLDWIKAAHPDTNWPEFGQLHYLIVLALLKKQRYWLFPKAGLGWVSLHLWVFGNGFEDGRGYLSAKCQVLLFVMVPTHCFSSPLSGCKTIRDVVKRPLKYPNINKLGHFVLSPVRVSASLALALQHFCMGRWLPNLPLDMPAAGPGACLAHRWYKCS